MSIAGDGTRYVMKEWYPERECDLKNPEELCLAASRLALLHKGLRTVKLQEEWHLGSILTEPLKDELKRHNRELLRAKNYIRGKRSKTEFEPVSYTHLRQKDYLRDLSKYHRINVTVQIDSLSRSEASRMIDQIISQYGRMTKKVNAE